MTRTHTYQPIIIIGAARSGTNMLRDILTRIPGIGTWPCDEIPYIWRHGNIRHPNDELGCEQATPAAKKYIRHAFDTLSSKQGLDWVVEKTCANSLRVSFVDQVLPNARYIFLVRDGRDVVVSAMKRWSASLDIPYLLKKARYVPPTDVPYYGVRFLWNRIYQILSGEKRLAFWGPRFEGMEEMLRSHSLLEVCAEQWSRCVQKSEHALAKIDSERFHELRYEDFVVRPEVELRQLLDSLSVAVPEHDIRHLVRNVSTSSVGMWQRVLSQEDVVLVESVTRSILSRHGYA